MVNGPHQHLRRARRQDLPGRRAASPTTPTCAAPSTRSSAGSAGASTRRSPMVDARLPDGSRVNAVIPPIALDGSHAHHPQVLRRPVHRPRTSSPSARSRPRCATSSRRASAAGATSSSPAAPAPARRRLLNVLSGVHPRRRAHRHHRGRRRAPAAPGARAAPGVAPGQHRGPRRRSRSATWCATRCACAPTASSSVRSATAPPSTCCRR